MARGSVQFRILSVLFVFFLIGAGLFADQKGEKVDELFAQWDTDDSPGCALAVIRDGQIIYKKGYGRPIWNSESPFHPAQCSTSAPRQNNS